MRLKDTGYTAQDIKDKVNKYMIQIEILADIQMKDL